MSGVAALLDAIDTGLRGDCETDREIREGPLRSILRSILEEEGIEASGDG
jgi:hypothetical protein